MPDGPFWLIYEHQFIQMYLNKGYIVDTNVIVANSKSKEVMVGKLSNNTYLTKAQEMSNVVFGESNCLKVIQVPIIDNLEEAESSLRLPMKGFAIPEEQRIMIRQSKIMNFNRVAKTGSIGVAHLLVELGLKLDFHIKDISANGADLDGELM